MLHQGVDSWNSVSLQLNVPDLSGKALYKQSRSAGKSSLSLTCKTCPTFTSLQDMSVVLPAPAAIMVYNITWSSDNCSRQSSLWRRTLLEHKMADCVQIPLSKEESAVRQRILRNWSQIASPGYMHTQKHTGKRQQVLLKLSGWK